MWLVRVISSVQQEILLVLLVMVDVLAVMVLQQPVYIVQ